MDYENEIKQLKVKNRSLTEKVEMLEFRIELLAQNSEIASFLLETNAKV